MSLAGDRDLCEAYAEGDAALAKLRLALTDEVAAALGWRTDFCGGAERGATWEEVLEEVEKRTRQLANARAALR